MGFEPNTKIAPGRLTQNHLEKFIEAYKKVGLNVTADLPSLKLINETNKQLKESEITPNPFGEADNKLYIGVKANHNGEHLYVDATIIPGENNVKNPEELREKYDELIRSYHLG